MRFGRLVPQSRLLRCRLVPLQGNTIGESNPIERSKSVVYTVAYFVTAPAELSLQVWRSGIGRLDLYLKRPIDGTRLHWTL